MGVKFHYDYRGRGGDGEGERGGEGLVSCPHMDKCFRRTCVNAQEGLWVLTPRLKSQCVSSVILVPSQSPILDTGASVCPHFLLMWGKKGG